MNQRTNERTTEWTSKLTNESSNEPANKRKNDRVKERKNERKNEWTSEQTKERPSEPANKRTKYRVNQRINERDTEWTSEQMKERSNEPANKRTKDRMNLLTVLFTFLEVLTRRICLTIKSFFSWISFRLFSWPQCLIQGLYCKEKLDASHSWGVRFRVKSQGLGWLSPCLRGCCSLARGSCNGC